LRCDGGGEYTGNIFERYLTEPGLIQRITPAYRPEHDGIAERANRTIMEMVRWMIFDSALGKEFWGFAALTAVHITNRLPSSAHEGKTPFKRWFGVPPSIDHLRLFGCITYRHIPSAVRRKLDPKGQKCRMIGYKEESGSPVYRVYDETTKQVLVTRDVVFHETTTIQVLQQDDGQAGVQLPGLEKLADLQVQERLATGNEGQEGGYSSEDEEEAGSGRPLLPIDPEEGNGPAQVYDQETITVRPPLVQMNIAPQADCTGQTVLDRSSRPQCTRPVR